MRAHRPARSSETVLSTKLRVPISAYVVDCAVYANGERLPGRWTHERALAEVRERDDAFVWIGLHEPDEAQITGIADVFGLHELAVEDAVHAHQRPKLERYDDMLFMVLKTVCYRGRPERGAEHEIVETGEVMVFLGP
ncbi:MAG TPA: CorA family divalent cation transporter, partial [Amycolatopsis sp.]|nr:CorA family divalent cation transporter [Amycolatopsis sp.]